MPINTRELLSVVSQLTENKHVRVTFRESLMGGVLTGVTAGVGGILLGPIGLAIGGTVGGISCYAMKKDQFKPISEVIMNDMTDEQRKRLAASINAVIADLHVEDIALLLPLLLNSPRVKEAVLRSVFAFLQNEMSLQIVD